MSLQTDILGLDSLSADPGSPVNGQVWYNSTTNTVRSFQNGAVKDLGAAGSGGRPWSKALYVDPTNANADYSTIQAAITAASAGTTILIGPGQYTEQLTMKNGVDLLGIGSRGDSAVSFAFTSGDGSTVTVGAGVSCTIQNLAIKSTFDTSRTSNAILVSGNAAALTLRDCDVQATAVATSGGGSNYAIKVSGLIAGAVNTDRCMVSFSDDLSTGSANRAAVLLDSDGTTAAFYARTSSFTNAYVLSSVPVIKVNGNAAYIYNCELSGSAPFGRTTGIITLLEGVHLNTVPAAAVDPDDDTTFNFIKRNYGCALTNGTNRVYKNPLRAITGDVGTPADGDHWYNSTVGKQRIREDGCMKNVHPLSGSSAAYFYPTTGAASGAVGTTPANTNTLSTPALANTNLLTSTRRTRYASTSSAGTSAGTRSTDLQWWRGNAAGLGGFYFSARFGFSTAVAQQRAFVGLYGTAAVIGNVNPSSLVNIVGVGYDAAQTTLRILYNDGTSTASSVDLGANFPVNTTNLYTIHLWCAPNSSSIWYLVRNESTGNIASGTLSSDLPVNTGFMIAQAWVNNGTTASAAQIDLAFMYCES